MKQHTPVLFFIAAAVFALNGGIGVVSGDGERSISGFAMSFFWLILGLSIKRKLKTKERLT